MDAFSVWTFVIAVLGCFCGVAGFILSIRSDRRAVWADQRATRAEEKALQAEQAVEAADVREVWGKLINAAQSLNTINVVGYDHYTALADVRSAMIELTDHPSSVDYEYLDEWFKNENQLFLGLFEFAKSGPKSLSPAVSIQQLADTQFPIIDCVNVFIANLRAVRLGLVKTDHDTQFEKLANSAREQFEDLKTQTPGLIPQDPINRTEQ